MKRGDADRAGDRAAPSSGFVLDQGDVDMLLATATEDFQDDPATAAIFLNKGQPFQVGRAARAEGPRRRPCGRSAQRGADGFYKGPVAAARSSPRARPARASSRRPTSTSTRRASSRRSNATTAATTSSRRRRRARAASSSARSSTSSRAIRSRTWASARRRPCITRSRRCATPTSTATAISAIPDFVKNPLDRLLDKGYAGEDPRRDRPEQGRRVARTSSPASRRTKAATRRTTRSSTARATRSSVTYTLNDWFGAKVTAAEDRRAAQRRDGRLHRQARRAEPVRPGAGRGQRDRAGQAAAELDEPDHRHARTASR